MTAALRTSGEDTGEIRSPRTIPAQPYQVAGPTIDPRPSRGRYTTATIEDLVAWAQAGDAEAFGVIYDRYIDKIYKYVFMRVRCHRQTAQDLTSDVFVRALKRIGSFTWQGRDIGAWLTTIARNLVADEYKSGRARFTVLISDVESGDHIDLADADPVDAPEMAALATELAAELRVALKYLTDEQRECLRLRFLVGLSIEDTASVLGRTVSAVKALQYRATRRVHRWLLADGFER